ncbi:hypothetical protein [Clostridium beijerinckii]|uniref:Uncharacterized protein n=1 Tax=Clostridium beijerinckii TaxID=1520 RepID=A0AAE5EXE0_CLOBE|nr:hypothetical protein [Clostridium beijerinckii]NOW89909.1 hypothetical protein [Clostridium beijerinckii]NSB13434.1 hypothetical protein [Clostridium beijerinckii]OOM28352.1 hypothetical protein CLOBE_27290 [Clostridium beijerinckii]
MKKFIAIFSIFLFLSFNIKSPIVMAQPLNKTLSEGIYRMKDLDLMENIIYNIQNGSSATIFMIIVDDNEQIIESRRLPANSAKYNIGPFKYDDKLVILGPGSITLTE